MLSYNQRYQCHECLTDEDEKILVDIQVANNDNNLRYAKPEDLIGKTVQCDDLYHYITIANNSILKT